MDNIEKRIQDFKQQLENKNSIILELENINKELNKQIHHTQKDKTTSVSKLERKLEKEEFKNFINTENNYAYSSKHTNEDIKLKNKNKSKRNQNIQLGKLESKLKSTKEETQPVIKKSVPTEEELLKKNLGF